MIQAALIRRYHPTHTLGTLIAWDGNKELFKCATMELAWNENKRRESCIPEGTYYVVPRESPAHGQHFHIKDVSDRDLILFHSGNWLKDTLGCVLVGQRYGDLNGDGIPEILTSKLTMRQMHGALFPGFKLQVLSIKM